MKRGASWFIMEVTKQLKRDPKSPVRLDATEEELKAFTKYHGAFPWKSYKWSPHANPALRRQGLYRVAFFGPAYSTPAPSKDIAVDWPAVKSEQAAARRAKSSFKKLEQLKTSYGPEYHVELMAFQRPPMFRVWRGEDWLAYHTAEFYPAEVAMLLGKNITESRWLEPDAARGRKAKRDTSKGAQSTNKRMLERRAKFLRVLRQVKRDEPDSVIEGQINEARKRLDEQGIEISHGTAYNYLKPLKK